MKTLYDMFFSESICEISTMKTRKSLSNKLADLIGGPKEFISTELPTYRTVLQQGIFLKDKNEIEEEISRCNYSNHELAKDLSGLILSQWHRSNSKFKPPVIIQEASLVQKIERLWGKASKVALNKCKKNEKNSFENDLDKLFDLTTCPHKITLYD